VAPFTLDTNYHSFEIRYTANTVWFYVDNVLRHQVSGTSAALTTSLTLPITVTNVKTSGGTDITFAVRNIGNGRFGGAGTDDRGYQQVVSRPITVPVRVTSSGLTTATTAYSQGDQMGTIFTIPNASKITGGTGTILSARVLDKADVITNLRLHFFRASVTLAADNAAFAVSDADMDASFIDYVTLDAAVDLGGNRAASAKNIGLGYDCAATSLFCAIENTTTGGHTFFGAATDLQLLVHLLLD
jgi:hypothetical protein